MGFVGLLLADKKKAANLAAELGLEAEEIALLLGSSPTTKKVQSIFEEASKIRAAELYEEVELGWQGTAQHSLGHAPQQAPVSKAEVKAQPEETILPSPVSVAATESVRAAGPKPEDSPAAGAEAAAAPPKKRGRPKKAEGEGKAEKKTETKATGKRQKSLFDF